MLHFCRWMFVVIAFVFLVGCGGGDVKVRGELHRGKQLYQPESSEQVMITFQQLEEGQPTANLYPTRLSPDGTFEIAGPDDKGIPAGTYRVNVVSLPEIAESGVVIKDKFNGVYENEKSPLQYEVSSSQRFIKIEIE